MIKCVNESHSFSGESKTHKLSYPDQNVLISNLGPTPVICFYFLRVRSRIVDEILRELATSGSPVAVVAVRELTALIAECYKRDPQHKRARPAKDFPHILYPGKLVYEGNAHLFLLLQIVFC